MRKLKLFLSMLMLIAFSVGNVWADPAAVGTTLFSENFGGYSADDVPSGSVSSSTGNRVIYGGGSVTYTSADNGTNKTKIYSANLAGGTSPELLVGKSGGVFTIADIPSGGAQEITVSFKQNAQKLTASLSGTGYSTEYTSPKPTAAGEVSFDITVDDGADATFTLILSAGSSNVRLDDILVTVKTAGEGGGPAKTLSSVAVSGTPTKTAYNTGDNFDPAGLTVTGTYSDASTAPITSGITWSYNPSQTLALNQTSIGVTATVSGISSEEYNVAGLSVTDPVVSNWQVVAPADLVTGDVVVLTMLKNAVYYAAPNNGGTNAPTATAVAVVGDKLSNDPAETLQWEVTVVSDGVYQFSSGGNYLKCTDTNNGVKVGTGDYNTFDVVVENEKSYLHTTETMSSASNGRYLGIYNTQDWRCYGSVNNNIKDGSLVIFKDASAAATVAKPTISGDENFVTSTEVTLACTTSGASIYYTTDGTAPSSSSTPYSAPFTLTDNATVKAIAILGSDESAIAEKTFTKVTALATMAEVQAAAETTEKAINVSINNWVVTAVSGSQVWFADADNAKGILLYKSSHGFTAGKKLNGTVIGTKIKLYNLYPELTSLVASEVTVTDAAAITPRTTTIAALTSGHPAEQGTVVKLENVTYSSSVLSDGVNSIAADNKFYSSLALIDGTTYNITGVVTYYKESDAAVVKIAPRTADDVEATSAVVIPTAANLAALKAAARGTYILTLTNAVVSYVNGNNAFIEDATGGALIYFASHGYSAGDCLNGDYQVTTTDYQGKFEITAIEPQAGAATTTAEIPLTTVSIATLNASFASYESRRIKIAGANVTDAISGSDRNGAINDGAAVAVYASVANTITLNADDNVDIIGYPGFHNTDQQLTVWRQEDITVNEKDPAGITFTPESETITDGDPWSAPAFANPNNLDVIFGTSNDEVATVSNAGVVSLEGGYGTAIITAHTDGDATHAAGNATYTITVNDPSATPVYTMSFDLTRASYDDAADAEVVWNSNVVTMTADKNDGTKVTNYLAGNYSGTTLIAETRLYAKNSISFAPKAGVTITKVEWMATAKAYATNLAGETWSNASAVVDGTNDKLVIITPATNADFSVVMVNPARATGVTVYYEAAAEQAPLTASISIANINTAVGDDDILLSAIAATSNPNKKAISYAITSGSEYVSITGEGKDAAFHALAEGTATVTATIPDNLGNYTGATTTFDIIVAAAPATLQSIAISGDASVLEYTEGQDFNPAGLVVTGTYSDASTAPITDGITWAFDPSPLTEGTTSVSVTATVGEISSSAFVVNGLTVSAAPTPTVDNVVILATYDSKYYAMSTNNVSSAFTAIAVEYDGSQVTVNSAEDKAAIQWTRSTSGENTTFQDADDKYMKSADGTAMSLQDAVCNWVWDENGYYKIPETARTFFYQNGTGFKNFATSNFNKTGYSDKAQVIVIDPANIVITSKVSAELAYDPASNEITQGDAWSAPVLGYVSGFDGLAAITYASDNEAVAEVTDAGVISLAGGTGTATITATFAGNANYLAGSATYTITVNAPAPTPTGTTYRKVIATSDITDGEYLIVYEDENVAFNGNLTTLDAAHNTVDVVISGDVIVGSTEIDAAVFTIDVANGTLRAHMGDYIGVTSYGNGLKQNANAETYPAHSFSIDGEGNAIISLNNSWTAAMVLNYNKGASDKRFRYYKSASPQQSIQLYKKETPTKDLIRGDLSNGKWGTLCPKQNVENVEGATFYQISYLEENGGLPYNMVFDEISGTTLTAGQPYFFIASANEIRGNKTGAVLDAAGAGVNGFYGYIGAEPMHLSYLAEYTPGSNNTYVIYGNMVTRLNGPTDLKSERCYININSTEPSRNVVAPAPGRARFMINVDGHNTPTGLENGGLLNGENGVQKVLINGNLYILRGEKMYDATGRLVK